MSTQHKAHVDDGQSEDRGASSDQRLATLEARVEHLEEALEGLQDAVYRQAVLEEEKLGEVRRQIAPEQMARELSRDARRRGL